MPTIKLSVTDSVLVVIDLQPTFLKIISEADRVVARSLFLCKCAKLFEIPILATEQYSTRMGSSEIEMAPFFDRTFDKMTFSATGSPEFGETLVELGRRQVVIVGIETHICVSQTALDLQASGYSVIVCPDALSSSTLDRHKLGMERLRDAGIIPIHSEAVAYEWCQTADNLEFRAMLNLVKESKF